MYELDHNDIFSDVYDILRNQKIGKMLVVEESNARVGSYQDLKVDDNESVRFDTLAMKHCTIGKILCS